MLKMLCLILLSSFFYETTSAQRLKRKQIVDEKKANSRRSEKNVVVVNTNVINELMGKCIEMGIGEVKLVFARIRAADIPDYIENHPEAAGYEKELIGKMTVLIKVEGDNINEENFVSDAPANRSSLVTAKMSAAGFVKVNRPYGNLPVALKVLYFEVGSICPPPNSCN